MIYMSTVINEEDPEWEGVSKEIKKHINKLDRSIERKFLSLRISDMDLKREIRDIRT